MPTFGTSKAASRLTKQFEERSVRKTYWACVAGKMPDKAGQCIDFVRKDDRQRRVVVCAPDFAGAKEARLNYEVIAENNMHQWLQIELETGRKHQIRVQLAARHHPIVGDKKYGSRFEFDKGISLHARHLELTHPTQNERMSFVAPVPKTWSEQPPRVGRIV